MTVSRPPSRHEIRREFISANLTTYAVKVGDAAFSAQREQEYPALRDTTYLDFAASPPAPLATMRKLTDAMAKTLYSNPHSHSPSSFATSEAISRVRTRVMDEIFGLKSPAARARWDVVFTAGATAAIKLVGESYAWKGKGRGLPPTYRYLREAHTSLVGVRGIALDRGAQVDALSMDDLERWLSSAGAATSRGGVEEEEEGLANLFAYPAQCNATGRRLGLEIGRDVKRQRPNTTVLLDAAAYLSTTPLDLESIPLEEAPDFIACSFYKIFGYPTGLGCLLVKLSASPLLSSRAYFGGGTVDALSTTSPFQTYPRTSTASTSSQLPPIHPSLEDGTLPFLSIIALGHAVDVHQTLHGGLSATSLHAASLASLARRELSTLRHANGRRVVHLHSAFSTSSTSSLLSKQSEAYGPTISLTILDPTSVPIGHVFLDRLATINGFQVRSGGLCNTGVLSSALDISDDELLDAYRKGRRCWDDEEFLDEDSLRPLGLVRISFGAASTVDDVLNWIGFIRKYFVQSEAITSLSKELPLLRKHDRLPTPVDDSVATLSSLVLYPIKSCGGQSISASSSWEISSTGLVYDREWMLVSPITGSTLSQKRIPRMALIRPVVHLPTSTLRIHAEGMPDLILPLNPADAPSTQDASTARLCGELLNIHGGYSTDVDDWFERFLGVPCRLHRYPPNSSESRHGHFDRSNQPVPILLSNESPFLLISRESVDQVNEWIVDSSSSDDSDSISSIGSSSTTSSSSLHINEACFRANFVISSSSELSPPSPFFEDQISLLRIGPPGRGATFQVLARCRRCLMVCVDQETGCKTSEPFSCLARTRKNARGRIEFGVHLLWRKDLSEGGRAELRVGDGIRILEEED